MRVAINKKPEFYKSLSFETLANGTASGVWTDEEAKTAHTSLGKQKKDELPLQ